MKATVEPPPTTQQGQQFKAPGEMTRLWAIVSLMVAAGLLAIVAGIVAAVMIDTAALGPALVVGVPFVAFGLLRAHFTYQTQAQVYPTAPRGPVIVGEPTVVFVRDRVKTPAGYVDKDAAPIDIGLPPRDAVRVLRWMATNGKTSRRTVCDGTGISQGAWGKLDKALKDFGILDGGSLTDEVDYLIKQLESQL